ncbi:UNVERIFIED_CONTAM: hypothetical protein GTU68_049504 [Idotea baltica]|nr:hypothetical protein [Idotea baltica]
MNKGDLISHVAEAAGITKTQASDAVNAVFGGITETLKQKDGKAAFIGFGTFSTKFRAETTRPNPLKKGTMMTISAKHLIKFKPGKALEDALNS